MSRIVAIVGRPNVGKSTLFNRFVEERKAIVDDMSGVTRDRNHGTVEWNGQFFTLIDTGGYVPESNDVFEKAIREQVHIAIEEADVLLFMVDVETGVHPLDIEFANILRRAHDKVVIAANKMDNNLRINDVFDFYELGFGDILGVSAINGKGTGDLLDRITELLPEEEHVPFEVDIPKFAIVGRPNVGKSSLVNALLGKNYNIVTPISGTTRDSIHTRFKAFGQDIYLIDTAGLRKKAKVQDNLEFYSTLRTIRAIEECDVALLLIDATQGLESQDLAIFQQILKNRKGVMIVVNKWDLVEKETNTARDYAKKLRERMAPMSDVPIVFGSALTKQRLIKALETAKQVYDEKTKRISTSQLNEVMIPIIERHHHPAVAGRIIRIKYVTQVQDVSIPTFLFFTNHPKHIKESYKRYLTNKLRENFGFSGVPLNVFFRQK